MENKLGFREVDDELYETFLNYKSIIEAELKEEFSNHFEPLKYREKNEDVEVKIRDPKLEERKLQRRGTNLSDISDMTNK